MSLGIDIHPIYQSSINWRTVKDRSDVEWVYVKVSDGPGPYTKRRPDAQVNGAKGVGLPVGGYHYAQFGNPTQQADVLVQEHRRLGLTLPPMLDLEAPFKPNTIARDFGITFLRRIAALTGYRPVVYMSSAFAKTLRPDKWDIPGLVIWIASYGPNDGKQHGLTGGYPGRIDIHQYTSVGRVNGITADTDVNKAYIDITNTSTPQPEDDDMNLNEQFFEVRDWANGGKVVKVDALTALGNLYGERFYGSDTDRWKGVSGRELDLQSAAAVVTMMDSEKLAAALVANGVSVNVNPEALKQAVKDVLLHGAAEDEEA